MENQKHMLTTTLETALEIKKAETLEAIRTKDGLQGIVVGSHPARLPNFSSCFARPEDLAGL